MDLELMRASAQQLVVPGKGILAADESLSTISRRFGAVDLDSTEESRRAYREMLFAAPGMAQFISGVILFDETIRQRTASGTPLPELLARKGVFPGIKVDLGAKPLAGSPGETITEGLDGLRDRLEEYRALGARFAKWRAVIRIGPDLPTQAGLSANAHALARYAAMCQEASLVPIVEPEILADGHHSVQRCFDVTLATLQAVFDALYEQHVALEACLLKPNMVLPGADTGEQPSPSEVADVTLRCLRNAVPPAVAGIVFLSGGQGERAATANLDAMNRRGPHPWPLTFSYGRALQDSALRAWSSGPGHEPAAQAAFVHRARCNGAASTGSHSPEMELAGTK
jgi:fructose-bisphosphate aldolase, class I